MESINLSLKFLEIHSRKLEHRSVEELQDFYSGIQLLAVRLQNEISRRANNIS